MAAALLVRTGVTSALTVLLLSGCGDPGGTSGPAQVDLEGSWHLSAGHDDGGPLPLKHGQVTLVVEGHEVGGRSGCNAYGTSVDVEGATVRFGPVGGTEMACDPPVMALETRYLEALTVVREADRRGDVLTLSGPDVALDFGLDPPVVDAELVGTRWVLESLIEGESVSSAMPGGRLVLRADGSVEATTGCGTASGDYSLRGRQVQVAALEAGLDPAARCTEQAVAQHDHVVGVLEKGFTAEVEGDRLTVTDDNGLGLDFRAR